MNQYKPAQPPGSLVYVGEGMKHTIHIEGISYNPQNLEQFNIRTVNDLPDLPADHIHWININGIHRIDPVRKIGARFNVPQLTLEDILNTEQRPKIDTLEHHLFIVIKMLYMHDNQIAYEHLSLLIGENYVLSFQEQPWDVFEPVRNRIKLAGGHIRNHGSDYLAYALIDAVVDNYLIVCDHVENDIELLEESIFREDQKEIVQTLHSMQRELIFLSKTFRGGREVLGRLLRCNSPLISQPIHLFLEDVTDHMLQSVESVDVYREMLNGLDNLHFSMVNQKSNDTMKLLTLYASIFMPLTFIAGIYGMNFENMPETRWTYGYPAILTVMAFLALGMIFFFRRKHWL